MKSQKRIKSPFWRTLEIGLDPKNLRERIKNRTEYIYKNGLLEETEQLTFQYGKDLPLLQTIGYKEAQAVLEGQIKLSEAINMTTLRTNQFAKKQRTWFKKQHNAKWLNDDEPLREALTLIQTGLG